MPDPLLSPVPVAEIERRLNWRLLAILGFGGLLVVLLAAALLPMFARPARVSGLPDDPAVVAASRLVRGCLRENPGGLRFEPALAGESAADLRLPPDLDHRLARARALLEGARTRLARDPRVDAALASLDLASHRYAGAARRYRSALGHARAYPEARLGLGVALACSAGIARHPLDGRGLLLRAIAQFAAVKPDDPGYEAALFNRALTLARVGRRDEARRLAGVYLARAPAGEWAERMREVSAQGSESPPPR